LLRNPSNRPQQCEGGSRRRNDAPPRGPEADWEAAKQRLVARWLFDGERLTNEGAALRARVEQQTDEAAMAPWGALSTDEATRLRALVRPWSRAISEGGVFGLR